MRRPRGPKGIVNSIWVSLIAGFILLVGVSAAIPHIFPVIIGGTNYPNYASIAFATVPWVQIDGQKDDGLVRILAEPNLMAISGQRGINNFKIPANKIPVRAVCKSAPNAL